MSDPVVKLESGPVRGVLEKHEDGFDYYAFKGIPYGEPPVGELRFKDPVAVKPWTEIKDCKSYGPMCLQVNLLANVTSYSEDCLHLNVFTRTINEPNTNAPVIVVIHGGLFTMGTGDDFFYGPDYLIRKDVVLITFDYRLGVLGFLNLEDEVAPGNQGLRDQLMALQWVQRNVRVFGGNPDNVTVLGLSVGSVCAQCLALSPLAKGLMHKLIVHSNSMYSLWPWVSNAKSNAMKFCSLLGKQLTDSKEILDFLRTVDAETLLKAHMQLWVRPNAVVFGIGVDDKSPNPLVPVHPRNLKNQAIHLPCLTGYNSEEALTAVLGILRKDHFMSCDADFEKVFVLNLKAVTDGYGLTLQQVRRLYYKNEVVSDQNLEKYVNLITELAFVEGIHKFVEVQAEQSSAATYFYVFRYESPHSFAQAFVKNTLRGAGHFDDMSYIFKFRAFRELGIPHLERGTKHYQMMEKMTEMWSNFARYGRPTIGISDLTPVHWLPVADGTVLRYLNVDDDITMQSILNIERKISTAKQLAV